VADMGCSANAAVAFDFLVARGLKDFQAAAVIGNLQQESRLNPRLEAMDSNGLPGRGIAMWQPPRWQNLLAFAAGRDPWALETQLDFVWHELRTDGSYGLDALMRSTTPEEATIAFQDHFERCKDCRPQNRISYAKSALYACPAVRPPEPKKSGGVVVAAVGIFALIAAAGYTAYEIVSSRPRWPQPEPDPEPPRRPFPRPSFRRSFYRRPLYRTWP
jgi:hypothetical protein